MLAPNNTPNNPTRLLPKTYAKARNHSPDCASVMASHV